MKSNCPKYLAKKKEKEGKYDLLVLETCLVKNDQNAWILGSAVTNHVFSSLQKTSSLKQLEEDEMLSYFSEIDSCFWKTCT